MSRRTALLAIPLTLLLAACGSAPSPVDHHFRLIAASPDRLGAPVLDGTLLVKRFNADGLLAQRPLVYAKRAAPQALYQYNYSFWVDTPTVMLQEITARTLRAAGVAPQVATPSHGIASRHVLVGRIDRLEHMVGETASVAVVLELGVVDEQGGELLWLKSYARERAVDSPGIEPAVQAMNTAVNEILSELVSDLAAR